MCVVGFTSIVRGLENKMDYGETFSRAKCSKSEENIEVDDPLAYASTKINNVYTNP